MKKENKVRISCGIDHAVHSTGVAFIVYDDRNCIIDEQLYVVSSGKVKKQSKSINHRQYYWENTNTSQYSNDDLNKMLNATRLADEICNIIDDMLIRYTTDNIEFGMEGSLFSSGFKSRYSRVNDLICYSTIIRQTVLVNYCRSDISRFHVHTPSDIKKSFTGKGNADKDAMKATFLKTHTDFDETGKVDDAIDAYAIAMLQYVYDQYNSEQTEQADNISESVTQELLSII